MRWSSSGRGNIDDMRGSTGGGFRAVPLGIGGFIVVALLTMYTGIDFFSLLGGGQPNAPSSSVGTSGSVTASPAEERMVDFVNAVAEDVQTTWENVLGSRYQRTRVTLFQDQIQSTCGFAQSATGPFYCPGDHKVYLDLGFFDELQRRFGAPGDFAQAYVLAHEFGHHIQALTGTESQMRQAQRSDPSSSNALSVRLELQADCYAGVWGHSAAQPGRSAQGKVELEAGDVDEGLRAAAAIGDDRLQKMATGRVMPERFTHGSSEQRVTWFRRGLESGDPRACDTFSTTR
jgi:predicted metalloprotease